MRIAQSVSWARKFPLHRGVYVGLLGPTYETRAEYRMARTIGGDAVGMSTIPEVTVASFYGTPTLAVSIITNVARPDQFEATSGHEVVAAGERAAHQLSAIFKAVVAETVA
jgi:purine-nucleoside phosphorylase